MNIFDSKRAPKAKDSVRQKLLTGAQRKSLEQRVRSHAYKLHDEIRMRVNSEQEPAEVKNARELILLYEGAQEEKVIRLQHGIALAAKQITNNLLFDSVESCLVQVEEFEERKAQLREDKP